MILVFAGAGASYAINPNKYPTTIEFFSRLDESIKKLSENSGGLLLSEEKGLESRASRPMKNARCEGRLTILEAARRGFSDSF